MVNYKKTRKHIGNKKKSKKHLTNKKNKRHISNKKMLNKKKQKRSRKAGKAIKSGSFGCVFSPELLCEGAKNRNPNNISKLLTVKNAKEEMLEIDKVKNALSNLTESQKQYFSVFNVTECAAEFITDPSDFENVTEKCSYIIDETSLDEFNDYIDNYKLINMPNYGIDLSELVQNIQKPSDLIMINNLVSDLVLKAVVPMNKLNVLHRDVKDVNIMYNKKNLVLIDWGFCAIGENKKKLPTSISDDYKPLMFNTPYSSLLLRCKNNRDNFSFADWFKTNVTQNNDDVKKTIIQYFYNVYYPAWSKNESDHFNWININIPKVFNKYSFPSEIINLNKLTNNIALTLIINYLMTILSSDLYVDKKYNFNVKNFYFNNYLSNCDIWGTCTVFFFIILKLQRLDFQNKDKIIFAYQDMLWNYMLKNGNLKIDSNRLFGEGGEIDKINNLILDKPLQSGIKMQPPKKVNSIVSNKVSINKDAPLLTKKKPNSEKKITYSESIDDMV